MNIKNLQVIYEDNHLIAINKPAGVLVQGDETGDTPLVEMVKSYIKYQYQKEGDVFLGVCHRIDRPVSGAVIFARTSKALERMNKLFASQEIKKMYWAVVNERPEMEFGHLENYLWKDREKNITKVLDAPSRRHPDAKFSTLDYVLLSSQGDQHLLEVSPLTGRPHQIRAQLSRAGMSIKGDLKYGAKSPNRDQSIHLHCRKMTFIHPVQKVEISIEADAPNEQIWNLFV